MNSDLQHKLQQFSAEPPEGVWNRIADTLDTDHLAQRLYQHEEQPPATTWQAVEKALDDESSTTKVVPFFTRYRTALRYGAVASLLVVILVSITLTMKRTEAGALEAGSKNTVPTSETPVTAGNNPSTPAASPGVSTPSLQKPANSDPSTKTNISPGQANASSDIPENNNTATASFNEYVTYSDGDGNVMRVSKKMADLLKCTETDLRCKKRLQDLQQKMAASAMTTDFTGVLDMLRKLQ